jgi:hypothetical protein
MASDLGRILQSAPISVKTLGSGFSAPSIGIFNDGYVGNASASRIKNRLL